MPSSKSSSNFLNYGMNFICRKRSIQVTDEDGPNPQQLTTKTHYSATAHQSGDGRRHFRFCSWDAPARRVSQLRFSVPLFLRYLLYIIGIFCNWKGFGYSVSLLVALSFGHRFMNLCLVLRSVCSEGCDYIENKVRKRQNIHRNWSVYWWTYWMVDWLTDSLIAWLQISGTISLK